MKPATFTATDRRKEAAARRLKWAERLEVLDVDKDRTGYEAARQAYNAATTTLDEAVVAEADQISSR